MSRLKEIKSDILNYGEANTSQGVMDEVDICIPLLQRIMESDYLSKHLLRAMLGDSESAKIITEYLDKHVESKYTEKDEEF
ncbi:MAG: hypothetical protein GOVbin4162_94 [Prokaryotic dsDNA virus sp.]|nr:MAG: hypothetical protein GOVbin4162_94 [Prokaryotic dsDNA virus sp.]|tara:strand:- start:218 stop:460 length:243 start_codon:yes stop_codon:yes gene_type:complete